MDDVALPSNVDDVVVDEYDPWADYRSVHVSSESTMDAVPSVAVNEYDPWADYWPVHVSSESTTDTAMMPVHVSSESTMDTAMLHETTTKKEDAAKAEEAFLLEQLNEKKLQYARSMQLLEQKHEQTVHALESAYAEKKQNHNIATQLLQSAYITKKEEHNKAMKALWDAVKTNEEQQALQAIVQKTKEKQQALERIELQKSMALWDMEHQKNLAKEKHQQLLDAMTHEHERVIGLALDQIMANPITRV